MKSHRVLCPLIALLFAGILSPLTCPVLEAESAETGKTPERILFIGNSISTGLNINLERLAGSATPPMKIAADMSLSGGTPLEGLWSQPGGRHEQILNGKYDRVVLQATLSRTGRVYGYPADTGEKFREYAGRFDKEIRESGGRTVLFMHWQFNEPDAIALEEIARLHRDVAAELGVEVAPVGLAFRRVQEERPDVGLLSDSVHSNFEGGYLAACVLYATLFKKSPVGLSFIGWGSMTPEQAAFLQRIAWETVQEYR